MNGSRSTQKQEEDEEEKKQEMGWGAAVLCVGAAAFVAWGVSQLVSSSKPEPDSEKMMKAPGRCSSTVQSAANTNTIKIMSYNVCFQEQYAIDERMKAIGDLVQLHWPHFICFQEITLNIYKIFQRSSWWGYYHCSVSEEEASERQLFCIVLSKYPLAKISNPTLGYSKTKIGRLSVAEIIFGSNESLFVASGHLKSARPDNSDPKSKDHKFTEERKLQAKEALRILGKISTRDSKGRSRVEKNPNVIFCGDMNWDEETDGEFPLPNGWIDAWIELRGKSKGFTYDTQWNKMLDGRGPLRKRLDRILCKLKGQVGSDAKIHIIGMEAIPDVTLKQKKTPLPVLPSDHYGLLFTVSIK